MLTHHRIISAIMSDIIMSAMKGDMIIIIGVSAIMSVIIRGIIIGETIKEQKAENWNNNWIKQPESRDHERQDHKAETKGWNF